MAFSRGGAGEKIRKEKILGRNGGEGRFFFVPAFLCIKMASRINDWSCSLPHSSPSPIDTNRKVPFQDQFPPSTFFLSTHNLHLLLPPPSSPTTGKKIEEGAADERRKEERERE